MTVTGPGVRPWQMVVVAVCCMVFAMVYAGTIAQREPATDPPPPQAGPSIRLEDLAAELAAQLASELDLPPAQRDRIAEVISDAGEVQVVVPPTTSPTPASTSLVVPSSTTTTTTTTTTLPPRPTVTLPDLGGLLDSFRDELVPTTAP